MRTWTAFARTVARDGLAWILRRLQLVSCAFAFAGPALAGVGGVDLLLRLRQPPGTGIEPAPPLRHSDGRSAGLVSGVSRRVNTAGVDRVDDPVLARCAHVV